MKDTELAQGVQRLYNWLITQRNEYHAAWSTTYPRTVSQYHKGKYVFSVAAMAEMRTLFAWLDKSQNSEEK